MTKIIVCPWIKTWIYIEELKPNPSPSDNYPSMHCDLFRKLQNSMKLIGFATSNSIDDSCWEFRACPDDLQEVVVYYYHSIEFGHAVEKYSQTMLQQLASVDTVISSGCFIHESLGFLCPKIKHYISSGDAGDFGDEKTIQYWMKRDVLKYQCWLLPFVHWMSEMNFFAMFNDHELDPEQFRASCIQRGELVKYECVQDIAQQHVDKHRDQIWATVVHMSQRYAARR